MEIASNEICLQTLRTCALNKRRGLAQEVGIMLAVLAAEGPTTAARKACSDLYEQSDEGSTEASGRTFRGVRYRVDACVALYEKIGTEAVLAAIGERRGVKAIGVLTDMVAGLNLFSLAAIMVYSGKGLPAPAEDRPAPKGKTIHVKTKHISVDVPEDIEPEELEAFGLKLIKLAKKVRKAHKEVPAQPVATPEPVAA